MKLYDYFRSSAAYRVRIALNLKGLQAERAFIHLRKNAQREAEYLAVNPQGLVPALVVDDGTDVIRDLVSLDDRIRYVRQEVRQPVGRKRNVACQLARGEIIIHWDDDDWSAPWRLRYQVEQLCSAGADVSAKAQLIPQCMGDVRSNR